jgi:hypothetical protein
MVTPDNSEILLAKITALEAAQAAFRADQEELNSLRAKVPSLEAELAAAKAAIPDAARLDSLVQERATVLEVAERFGVKAEGSTHAIKSAIVHSKAPNVRLDSVEAVDAAYQVFASLPHPTLQAVAPVTPADPASVSRDDGGDPLVAARKRLIARNYK